MAEIFVVGFHVTVCTLRAVGEGDAGADEIAGLGADVDRDGVGDAFGAAGADVVALGAAASGDAGLADAGAGVTADPLALGAEEGAKTATFCVSDSPE